jgi:ABC-type transport system involved in cytochrome bd biosynthesis fused ATPase/permease subunit
VLSELADKTVIFVTHQVEFLPAADMILVWLYGFVFHLCIKRPS